jgi:hypothetical protein
MFGKNLSTQLTDEIQRTALIRRSPEIESTIAIGWTK